MINRPHDRVNLTDRETDALVKSLSQQDDDLITQVIEDNNYLRRSRWGLWMWGLMLGFAVGVVFAAIVESVVKQ